jgi:hypothetical protein
MAQSDDCRRPHSSLASLPTHIPAVYSAGLWSPSA